MAVSNHKVAASDGSTANPAQVYGGTFIDGGDTSASAAISNRLGMGLKRDLSGTGPTESVHGEQARSSYAGSAGTWAYQAAGSYVVRRMATTINGIADTVLQSGGSNHPARSIHVRSNQIGAKLGTKWRANQFSWIGTSGSRHNWVDGSNAAEAPATANANYADNTGALSATSDDAARPTRAIPGELVYLESHVTWTDNMIDYATRN